MHASELGCDPRGNPLKRIYFDALQEAAQKTAPPVLAASCRARRECIRGGLVGVGLALVATAGLLTGALCVEKAAHRRFLHHHSEHAFQQIKPAIDFSNGPTMRAVEARPEEPALTPEGPRFLDPPLVLPETPKNVEKLPELPKAPDPPILVEPNVVETPRAVETPKAEETPAVPEAQPQEPSFESDHAE